MVPRLNWPFSFPSLVAATALLGIIAMSESVSAQPTYVEEDWEVVIGVPDPDGHAPQIITAMSSTDRLEDVHVLFELNHATLPNYQAGGMGLQIWSSETNLAYMTHPIQGVLNHQDEVIRYTMTQKISNGVIKFEVKNGSSTTWGTGTWGKGGFYLQVPTSQTAVPNYSPETSVKFSKIAFAKHRVKKFALKASRTYGPNGALISQDNTERIVHQLTEATP
jgi:hypothetical protein